MKIKFYHYIYLLGIVISSCNSPTNKSEEPIFDENKTALDSLLSSANSTDVIIAIDESISKRWESDDRQNNLTQQEKNFYYIEGLEREVNNGGFSQYFYNSSGDYAHETLSALKQVGANYVAVLLQKAINEFPEQQVQKNRETREGVLSKIESRANKTWDKLDDEYYHAFENLEYLLIKYVKSNRAYFDRFK